jgi:hypothetical protein
MRKHELAAKTVLGLTEDVIIISGDKQRRLRARVDTGAVYSSIDERLATELNIGPAKRSKVIRSASGKKLRPFVMINVRINSHDIEEEFTVADRSSMTYPVLIGQNVLKKGNFLIDPLKE